MKKILDYLKNNKNKIITIVGIVLLLSVDYEGININITPELYDLLPTESTDSI